MSTLDARVVLTYDGGVVTLDTGSGEILDDVELEGYTRVNAAGDGRHVMVSTAAGFQAYDTGILAEEHGDHFHYYESPARLTETIVEAERPGHVVRHDGLTALFADGTGEVTIFDPTELADGRPDAETWTAPAAHHGVAVPLSGGGLAVSVGDEDGRHGAALLDADRTAISTSENCPGLHGEATAEGEAVVFGCEDGPLLLQDGSFTKLSVKHDYARSGNLVGHDASPVVLGDYEVDPDAELERPERIALIDTAAGEVRLVDLGASYSFRSLGRGPQGEALVLTTDGSLRVIDQESGEEIRRSNVVAPWEEPADWQQPRPALRVADGIAYVTEPVADQLHAVEIDTGQVLRSYDLPHTPDELVVSTGFPPSVHAQVSEGHDHGEDGHGGTTTDAGAQVDVPR